MAWTDKAREASAAARRARSQSLVGPHLPSGARVTISRTEMARRLKQGRQIERNTRSRVEAKWAKAKGMSVFQLRSSRAYAYARGAMSGTESGPMSVRTTPKVRTNTFGGKKIPVKYQSFGTHPQYLKHVLKR